MRRCGWDCSSCDGGHLLWETTCTHVTDTCHCNTQSHNTCVSTVYYCNLIIVCCLNIGSHKPRKLNKFLTTNYNNKNYHITHGLRAKRQQVVTIKRYFKPEISFQIPRDNSQLTCHHVQITMPKYAMWCPCKCQQHTGRYCVCCKILHAQQWWL